MMVALKRKRPGDGYGEDEKLLHQVLVEGLYPDGVAKYPKETDVQIVVLWWSQYCTVTYRSPDKYSSSAVAWEPS